MFAMKPTKRLLVTTLVLTAACLLSPLSAISAAHAQVGEQAQITTRSDVKMSIEGAPGTGGARLDALAKHLGTPLGEVKRCYGEIVRSHPEVTGTLLVDVELPAKGPTRVSPVGAANLNKDMRKCVEGAFRKITGAAVPRPAAARVVLELSNSAADSVQDVRALEKDASHVEVKTSEDGRMYSEGTSIQGELRFRVSAHGADAKDVVERVHTAVRDALPSLFDCRRKAGKLGSPEGDVELDVTLLGKNAPKVEVRKNTVNSDRAEPCVDRAITQGLTNHGRGNAQLFLHFAP